MVAQRCAWNAKLHFISPHGASFTAAGLAACCPHFILILLRRWGYTNVGQLAEVVAGYEAASIPLETIWSDIDHMDGYRIFTLHCRTRHENQSRVRVVGACAYRGS